MLVPPTRTPRYPSSSGCVSCTGHRNDGSGVFIDVYGQIRLYMNLLRQVDAPHLLRAGFEFPLDVYARYGPRRLVDIALPFLATSTARIPLPPLGTVRLDPATMLSLPPFVILQPPGHGRMSLRVPNDPTLAGLPIHTQVLLVQSPTDNWLTQATSDVVLR